MLLLLCLCHIYAVYKSNQLRFLFLRENEWVEDNKQSKTKNEHVSYCIGDRRPWTHTNTMSSCMQLNFYSLRFAVGRCLLSVSAMLGMYTSTLVCNYIWSLKQFYTWLFMVILVGFVYTRRMGRTTRRTLLLVRRTHAIFTVHQATCLIATTKNRHWQDDLFN